MRLQDLPRTNASKILRITAKTVWVTFVERSWADLNGRSNTQRKLAKMTFMGGTHAVLPISEDVTALCYAYMDDEVSLDGGALGLILEPKSQNWRYAILLLRSDGDHYQRIGLVRV